MVGERIDTAFISKFYKYMHFVSLQAKTLYNIVRRELMVYLFFSYPRRFMTGQAH